MDRWIPKQQKNPVKAIREMCIEYMGGGQPYELIKECPNNKCALYAFRFGSNPYRKPMSEERRVRCRENIKVLNKMQGVG